MHRSENTRYLLIRWIPLLLVTALMGFGALYWLFNAEALPAKFAAAFVIALPLIVIIWAMKNQERKLGALLRESTPQPLMAYYERAVGTSRGLEADALLSVSKALGLIAFGHFRDARDVIGHVPWQEHRALVRASGAYLDAIVDYLDLHDYNAGLDKAIAARALADAPRIFPGVATSLRPFEAALRAGRLLSGDEDETAESLRAEAEKLPAIQRAIFYQLIYRYYIALGDTDEEQAVREALMGIVPSLAMA